MSLLYFVNIQYAKAAEKHETTTEIFAGAFSGLLELMHKSLPYQCKLVTPTLHLD